MFKRITSSSVLKYSVVVMLLQCNISNEGVKNIKQDNFHSFSKMISKLQPKPIWTKQLKYCELFWGIRNGICWYPQKLNFEDKDFKIGFFFFGLNIHTLLCSFYWKVFNGESNREQDWLGRSYFCYILSFKLKYWYISFFNLNMLGLKDIRNTEGSNLFAFIAWLSPAIFVDMSWILSKKD